MTKLKNLPKNYKGSGPLSELSNMKYKDLQIACITRKMMFEEVVEKDYWGLRQFFVENYHIKQERSLLDDFDDWMDGQLDQKGYAKDHPLRSGYLRKGFIGSYDEAGNVLEIKKPRIKGLKLTKSRKEKDEHYGIFKGTKKALTFQCFTEGKSLDETIPIVLEKFPEALPKSIRIWYNKARKNAKK